MPTEADPIVGNWYSHLDKGQRFQVVAVDEDARSVEIQHFDGTLEEIELTHWYRMNLELCAEPESWAGAEDIGDADDYGTEITDTEGHDWNEAGEEYPAHPRRRD